MGLLNGLGLPAVMTDLAGIVRACNRAATELYQCEEELLVGHPLGSGALSGNVAPWAQLIAESVATGSWLTAVRLMVTDEKSVTIDVRATPMCDADGRTDAMLVVFGGASAEIRAARDPRRLDSGEPILTEAGSDGDPWTDQSRSLGVTQDVAHRYASGEPLGGAQATWRATMDSVGDHVAVLDQNGTIIEVNDAWRRFARSQGDGSNHVGMSYLAACQAEGNLSASRAGAGLRELLGGRRDLFELEYPCHSPTETLWFAMRATRHVDGARLRVVVAHRDISDARRQQKHARLQTALLDEVDAAVHASDLSRTVLSWNRGAERLFGWTAGEAIGRRLDELVSSPGAPLDSAAHDGIVNGPWEGGMVVARKDGSTFPAYVRTRLVRDEDGEATIVAVTLDVTKQLQAERELTLARNRMRAVTDSVGEGIFALDAEGRVTYMNPVAEKSLSWCLEDLAGTLMHEMIHFRHADGTAFPIDDCPIVHASRDGAATRIDDDVFIRSGGTDLPVAYSATPFSVDQEHGGCVVVFQDISERKTEARRVARQIEELASLRRVREALDEDRLVLFAQPIVSLADESLVQRELLIRMRDPDPAGGLILPGEFLPVAEEYGLILEIDRWVIDQSIELAARGLPVELNVSASSIGDPGLIPHIAAVFERTGADPAKVIFEITETALLRDEAAARGFVEWLHEIGCGVALDDFGSGYAGFTYLKQLPIDFLKIDIEFVRDLTYNPASRNLVETIVNLAGRFELTTIAEGVEDAATFDLLGELGVSLAQGYHIGRPGPVIVDHQPTTRGG